MNRARSVAVGMAVTWYRDKPKSQTMDQLAGSTACGKAAEVGCRRMDRLGRKASGLTAFFASLQARRGGLFCSKIN